MAQLVARLFRIQKVTGSIPVCSTLFFFDSIKRNMEIKIDMAPEDRPRRTSVKICNFIYLVSSLLRDTKLRFIEYFDAGIPLQGGKRYVQTWINF